MKKFSSITRVNSRRISQNKKIAQILLVTIVCVAVVFLVPKVVNIGVSIVVAPINLTKHWVKESGQSFPQYFRNRSELLEEIAVLQSNISFASGDHTALQTLARENAELRSLLGDEGEERVLAGIIGRPGMLPYDSLMIDKGTQDGVTEGSPVYIGGNTVVGLIKNATAHTALVELVTTSGFEATVYIMGPNIYTNAVGMGGGQLRVGVPQGIALSEGDIVVLPAVTSGVYGVVSVVQSEPSRPEQYGYVAPKIPMTSIRLVSVGKTPLQNISFSEAQIILKENKTTVFSIPVPENILVDTDSSTTTSSSTLTDTYEE